MRYALIDSPSALVPSVTLYPWERGAPGTTTQFHLREVGIPGSHFAIRASDRNRARTSPTQETDKASKIARDRVDVLDKDYDG